MADGRVAVNPSTASAAVDIDNSAFGSTTFRQRVVIGGDSSAQLLSPSTAAASSGDYSLPVRLNAGSTAYLAGAVVVSGSSSYSLGQVWAGSTLAVQVVSGGSSINFGMVPAGASTVYGGVLSLSTSTGATIIDPRILYSSGGINILATTASPSSDAMAWAVRPVMGSTSTVLGSAALLGGTTANSIGSVAILAGTTVNSIGSVALVAGTSANTVGNVTVSNSVTVSSGVILGIGSSGLIGDVQLLSSGGTFVVSTTASPSSDAMGLAVRPVMGSSATVLGSAALLAGTTANSIGSVALLGGTTGNTLGAVALLAGSSVNIIGSVANVAGTTGTMIGAVTVSSGVILAAGSSANVVGSVALVTGTTGTVGGVQLAPGSTATTLGSVALLAGSSANTIGGVANVAVSTAIMIGTVTLSSGGISPIYGDISTGSTAGANPLGMGARAATTNPTAGADGARLFAMSDKVGRQVVRIGHVRDLVISTGATITSTAEAAIVAAAGAGVFSDITHLRITHSSTTNIVILIRSSSGSATTYGFALAGNGGITELYAPAWVQATANSAWTAELQAAGSTVYIGIIAERNV